MDNKSGKIILWIITALAILLTWAYFPSRGSFIILLGVIIMIPIKKMEAFWASKNVKLWVRFLAGLIFMFVGMVVGNNSDVATAHREQLAQERAAETAKENKKIIVDTWNYGESKPLDEYYTFNEDGTFHKSSDGGEDDEGKYEIVDGTTIKMHGDWSDLDYTFTIVDENTIADKDGEKLHRYVREEE